jgi:hypothetical protein
MDAGMRFFLCIGIVTRRPDAIRCWKKRSHRTLHLGKVGLDSFIVNDRTGLPGEGHWKSSAYDREEWE